MGTDKALLVVEGRPMAVRVADALAAAGARPVVAVGGDGRRLARLGLGVVPDTAPGEGPLGGIVTALERSPHGIVVVAACDLVAPCPQALAATVDALVATPGTAVAVPVVGGRRQWAHAAWRSEAAGPLRAAFDAGERAVHAACAVAGLGVAPVTVAPAAVRDADVPADLGLARPLERSGGAEPGLAEPGAEGRNRRGAG